MAGSAHRVALQRKKKRKGKNSSPRKGKHPFTIFKRMKKGSKKVEVASEFWFQLKWRVGSGLVWSGLVRSYDWQSVEVVIFLINGFSTQHSTFWAINSHNSFPFQLRFSLFFPFFSSLPLSASSASSASDSTVSFLFSVGYFRQPWAVGRRIWSSLLRRLVSTTALFWEPFFQTLVYTHFLIFFKLGFETALVDS